MNATFSLAPGVELSIIPALAVMLGLTMYAFWRRSHLRSRSSTSTVLKLDPSFESGGLGGCLGGLAGGILVGVAQYMRIITDPQFLARFFHSSNAAVFTRVFIPIAFGVTLSGGLVGAAVQGGILLVRRARDTADLPALLFNDVTGGAIGGLIIGIFGGGYAGWYLAHLTSPTISAQMLLLSAMVALGGVVFGSLVYTYRGSVLRLFRVVLLTSVVAVCCAAPLLVVFSQGTIDWFFLVNTQSRLGPDARYLLGGMLLGATLCVVLGIQAGLTFLAYGAWNAIQEAPDDAIAVAWSKRLRRGAFAVGSLLVSPKLAEAIPGLTSANSRITWICLAVGLLLISSTQALNVELTKDGWTIQLRRS